MAMAASFSWGALRARARVALVFHLHSLLPPTHTLPTLCHGRRPPPSTAASFSASPTRSSSSARRASSADGSATGAAALKVAIVESPSKAMAIEKYLAGEYIVLPTHGHVRDLAGIAGAVRPDEDYTLLWEVPSDALAPLSRIKAAIRNAKTIVLATDPDREGEAMAWHIHEYMKAEGVIKSAEKKVLRATFNEITKAAVLRAIDAPRSISMPCVNSYLARHAMDHLIGFGLSPLLWRKLPGSKCAGQVQSVALAIICERENSIEDFVPKEYWTVDGDACLAIETCRDNAGTSESLTFKSPRTLFSVVLTHVDQISLKPHPLDCELKARAIAERLPLSKFHVSSIRSREVKRNPPMPYITSTLQQDGLNKLRFSSKRTMSVAQQLYEGVVLGNGEHTGLITYTLTDGFQLAEDAAKDIHAFVSEKYGKEYAPAAPQAFEHKVKNAQEAHEAIRPTDIRRVPSMLFNVLDEDALQLYSLIWRQTMACQMKEALYNDVTVQFTAEDGKLKLQSHNSSLSFVGFLAAMQDNDANFLKLEEALDETAADEWQETKAEKKLPELKEGDEIVLQRADMHQHFTRPPPQFSEASLIMKLEELGIGRPSTYAQILMPLQSRNYVKVENFYIFPEARGRMVMAFLSHFFPNFTDYTVTAKLEEQLDEVSADRMDWKDVLKGFWLEFKHDIDATMQVPVLKVVEILQETFTSLFFKGLKLKTEICPSCMTGNIALKVGRYGRGLFFACDRFPSCRFKAEVISDEETDCLDTDPDEAEVIRSVVPNNDRFVGIDPRTGRQIIVRLGPFGHYIQLGNSKLKRDRLCFRIPAPVNPDEVTMEKAIELMKYPLSLGKHPEDGEPVWVGTGRHSFNVKHRGAIASIPKGMEPSDISLEKALELLKGDKVSHGGRSTSKKVTNKEKKDGSKMARNLSKLAQTNGAKQKVGDRSHQRKAVKTEANDGITDKEKADNEICLITEVNQSGNDETDKKKATVKKSAGKTQVIEELAQTKGAKKKVGARSHQRKLVKTKADNSMTDQEKVGNVESLIQKVNQRGKDETGVTKATIRESAGKAQIGKELAQTKGAKQQVGARSHQMKSVKAEDDNMADKENAGNVKSLMQKVSQSGNDESDMKKATIRKSAGKTEVRKELAQTKGANQRVGTRSRQMKLVKMEDDDSMPDQENAGNVRSLIPKVNQSGNDEADMKKATKKKPAGKTQVTKELAQTEGANQKVGARSHRMKLVKTEDS